MMSRQGLLAILGLTLALLSAGAGVVFRQTVHERPEAMLPLFVTANGGLPYTVSTGFDRAFTGGGGRPNLVPNCKVFVGEVSRWFDPNSFSLQEAGTLGNLGRNTLI